MPTQQQFKNRAVQLRRASASNLRPCDTEQIPAITPPAVVNGLDYHAYEMATPWTPDWTTQTSVTSGTYTFYLTTDTGAFVRIHDAKLLGADFGYSAGTGKSSGTIPLKAGYHPIRIDYRHASAASHAIGIQWEGPGITKQAIPATAWFREGVVVVPVPPTGRRFTRLKITSP